MRNQGMPILAVDFDNTLYVDAYPDVGEPIEGALEIINKLYNRGWTIIVNTCREAAEAAIWKMELDGYKYDLFNENDPDRIAKYEGDPRKIGSDVLIDDKALPFLLMGVDWVWIEEMLEDFEDLWISNQTKPE